MNSYNRQTSQLYAYVRFLLWMTVFLVAVDIFIYIRDFYSGLLMTLGIIGYIIIILIYYFYRRRKALSELVEFAASFSSAQTKMMENFSFPYVLIDKKCTILWGNDQFYSIAGEKDEIVRTSICGIFEDLNEEDLNNCRGESYTDVFHNDRIYHVEIRFITDENAIPVYDMPDIRPADLTRLMSLSFFDETDLREYKGKYEDETMVPLLLYLDNYEETLELLDDVRRSIMTAVIDRKLNSYFAEADAIIRKFERDKYLVLMRNKTFTEMKAGKFNILQEMKNLNVGNDMTVTVSIGAGTNQGSYTKNLEAARISIDLALGRGGDQVVIKDGEGIQYFGGKAMAVEKNTKVKARVKAHALFEFMSVADRVLIMGHRNPDADSIGAAVGIYAAARTINRKAHIVIDSENSSVAPIMNSFRESSDFEADMFIDGNAAKEMTTDHSVLVIVDTCVPDITACPALLERTKNTIVLDHHRRGSSVIQNTVLSYIEPYASSACEMTAEILQYFPENVKIRNAEADALYAGMIVDTDNFVLKTGVRTFEAAAYLRRSGADSVRVRKMLRDELNDYLTKEKIIANAELYRGAFAISRYDSSEDADFTVAGAQAANSLLNIRGVKASFVLTNNRGTVYISARAIDEVNVQVIMERLGGGGHINIAGTQLADTNVSDAEEHLKRILDELIDGGDI